MLFKLRHTIMEILSNLSWCHDSFANGILYALWRRLSMSGFISMIPRGKKKRSISRNKRACLGLNAAPSVIANWFTSSSVISRLTHAVINKGAPVIWIRWHTCIHMYSVFSRKLYSTINVIKIKICIWKRKQLKSAWTKNICAWIVCETSSFYNILKICTRTVYLYVSWNSCYSLLHNNRFDF